MQRFGRSGRACDPNTLKQNVAVWKEIMRDEHMSWISSAWHLASRFHISAALSGFHRILCMSAPVSGLLFAAQFPMALRLSAYQHLASDLMISSETPQDEGTIFTQQQLWHLQWWRKLCQRLFWGFLCTGPGRAGPYKPTDLCSEWVSVCVCVCERDWWERKREGDREASLTPVKVRRGSSCWCR